ncbi:DDE-type integrase/transposase/recombinase [Chryseobacterium sp. 3008163]|uniref:DDE-type integrase/transposase/recombinase n=1 Tax=Chryseobacterium sp. 3008163 TaxID=2478663 RepID=UPI003977E100
MSLLINLSFSPLPVVEIKDQSYLSLSTDAYSKKIFGHCVANNVNTESRLKALRKVFKNHQRGIESLIHHSDRGLQYCSNEYKRILKKHHVKCSMTQNSDPYENAWLRK